MHRISLIFLLFLLQENIVNVKSDGFLFTLFIFYKVVPDSRFRVTALFTLS